MKKGTMQAPTEGGKEGEREGGREGGWKGGREGTKCQFSTGPTSLYNNTPVCRNDVSVCVP